MKKSILLLLSLIAYAAPALSQTAYWQQEVDYTIAVRLDDKHHELHGQESFRYTNHSPDQLTFLYIHLWPNAYSSWKTALGKQLYQNGEQLLRFGPDSLKGGIDSLNFSVNGVPATWEFDPQHPDIAKLYLKNPLEKGGSVTVSTPFRVRLPSGEISRLGHVGESYQITQWYPKPAVYDKNGWNQIPYLNQGEFYSEYGSFDVSITLPQNYVVGATGDLQTASELEFLNERAVATEARLPELAARKKVRGAKTAFPPSDAVFKTIRYTQKNVHDFAWFADKRFEVLKGQVELPESKRTVTSWAMFVPHNAPFWQKAIEYINDGTYYYSLWNGDYPYNQVTAVDGTISAGGGMEYPNVTVIGNASSAMELEIVIVHEVGHNWFYGILGTNERVHGWMDEGMNTLNELRYIYTKYPNNTNLSDMLLNGSFHLDHLSHYDMSDYTYRLVAGMGEDQPIETHSADFTDINYGGIMYSKTGLVFNYLKQYLGDETFDRCMKAYYTEWQFKHPQPEDMRAVLERESGKDLSWLFDDLIQTTNHIDYRLKRVQSDDQGTVATVKNVGQVNGPIEVGAYVDGKLVETRWAEPSEGPVRVTFNTQAEEVRINPSGRTPEMYRENNNWHRKGLFGKLEPIKPEFLAGNNDPAISNVFIAPALAGNQFDKFMLGVLVHNFAPPFTKFNYLLMPMYSFGGQRVSGMADLQYTFLPKATLKLSRFGLAVRSFKQYDDTLIRKNDGYFVSVSPYWFAKIGNRKAAGPWSHNVLLQSMYRADTYAGITATRLGAFLKYEASYNRADHQLRFTPRVDALTNTQTDHQLLRLSAEATYRWRYMKREKDRWLELRGYFGTNFASVSYLQEHQLSLSGANGVQDFFIEDYYFGRTATAGFLANQRLENMGAFKSPTRAGSSDDWIAAVNFYTQLPVGPGIFGVFADLGFASVKELNINQIPSQVIKVRNYYDAGLAIRLGKVAGLYFPLLQSQNILDAYGTMNYTARIRFTLRMSITNRGLNLASLI